MSSVLNYFLHARSLLTVAAPGCLKFFKFLELSGFQQQIWWQISRFATKIQFYNTWHVCQRCRRQICRWSLVANRLYACRNRQWPTGEIGKGRTIHTELSGAIQFFPYSSWIPVRLKSNLIVATRHSRVPHSFGTNSWIASQRPKPRVNYILTMKLRLNLKGTGCI